MSNLITKTFYSTSIIGSAVVSMRMAHYCYHDVVNTDNIFPKNLRFPLGIYSGVLGGMTGAMLGSVIGATFPISIPLITSYYIREKKKHRNL